MSLLVLIFIFSSISVQAGVVVKMNQEAPEMNIKSEQTMYIEKDRLRMEMSGEEENQIIIFRGDKNVFWVIDTDKKTYFEMTQDDIVKLKSQMEKMQAMMKEQMKNMPPEQRKMMEDMMPSSMPGEKQKKVTYIKKSSGVKVGKWTTTHYEGTQDGKKTDELWTVDWSQVGIDRGEFGAMSKMAEFFSALSQDATEFMKVGSEEWEKEMGISGMPVRWVDIMNGGTKNQGSVEDISEKALDASLFELPTGYEKDQSPWEKEGAGMNPYMEQ
jgi:isochorismate hydrolase